MIRQMTHALLVNLLVRLQPHLLHCLLLLLSVHLEASDHIVPLSFLVDDLAPLDLLELGEVAALLSEQVDLRAQLGKLLLLHA